MLAAMLSWQIPRVEREQVGPDTKLEKEELHAPSIVLAGSAMGLLRGAVGFLTFFLAFGLRNNDEAPWVFGLVLVLSGVGGFLGNLLAPQLRKITREEVILAGSLVLPAVGCLFAARSAFARDDDVRGIADRRRRCRGTASRSTACSSATRPTQYEGAASPGSRRASRSRGWPAR